MPLACSGRNLAYRRRVYDDVGGFASIGHLIGGDDVYFARQVAARGTWKMIFNWRPEAIVENVPDSVDLAALVNQKLRHASKASRYGGLARLLGIGAYLFVLLSLLAVCQIAVAMLAWIGLGEGWPTWAPALSVDAACLALVGKVAVDMALLRGFIHPGPERRLLGYLPLLEILYIPYILLFVPIGGLGIFRWKGDSSGMNNSD